jgi:tryptophan halogenase
MNITIVGGGTAGWISAFLLAKKQPAHKYTVIESSQIPIIGVGEGVTGQFTEMFNDPTLGLDEFEFIQETWALPKYGIEFSGWTSDQNTFYSPIEGSITSDMPVDLFLYNTIYHDKDIGLASISGHYYKENKVPWFVKEGNLHWQGGKAYHIDAYKVSEYFKKKAIEAGVLHIDDKVVDINVIDNTITSVILDNTSVTSDFFIDCSGFSKILMSKLNNKWIDVSEHLPANSALLFSVVEDKTEKFSYTKATALKHGWVFEIPTRKKIGRGYIFSDKFCTEEEVVADLTNHYGKIEQTRVIKFTTGRYEQAWVGNCLTIGLSANFIEPLQATSLHVSMCQLNVFIRDCLTSTGVINEAKLEYNEFFNKICNDLLDFVHVTYMGGRTDSAFWEYMTNKSNPSSNLKKLLEKAQHRLTVDDDFEKYEGYAGQSIWNYTLAGLGYFNKDVIKEVMARHQVNIENLNYDWGVFSDQMTVGTKSMMSAESLNSLLLKGENLKLQKLY